MEGRDGRGGGNFLVISTVPRAGSGAVGGLWSEKY